MVGKPLEKASGRNPPELIALKGLKGVDSIMAKRSWLEANDSPQVGVAIGPAAATTVGVPDFTPFTIPYGAGVFYHLPGIPFADSHVYLPWQSRRRGYDLLPGSLPPSSTAAEMLSGPSAYLATGEQPPQGLTSVEISRKVKACAACRKQKVGTIPRHG